MGVKAFGPGVPVRALAPKILYGTVLDLVFFAGAVHIRMHTPMNGWTIEPQPLNTAWGRPSSERLAGAGHPGAHLTTLSFRHLIHLSDKVGNNGLVWLRAPRPQEGSFWEYR